MSTCFAFKLGTWNSCARPPIQTSFSARLVGYGAPTTAEDTWARSPLPDKDVIYLATNPLLPGIVVAFARANGASGVGTGGIWLSRDAGKFWRRINKPLANTNLPSAWPLCPLPVTSGILIREPPAGGTPSQVSRLSLVKLPAFTLRAMLGTVSGVPTPPCGLDHACDDRRGEGSYSTLCEYLGIAWGHRQNWRGLNGGSVWTTLGKVPPTSWLVSAPDSSSDLFGYSSSPTPTIYRARLSVGRAWLHLSQRASRNQ